jgi:mRNA interferase RelE/StbE
LNVEFRESFLKDVRKIKDKSLLEKVRAVIKDIEAAESLDTIPNLKKLVGVKEYYRVRIGDYRFGLKFEQNALTFIRFLNRKEIYRYFP